MSRSRRECHSDAMSVLAPHWLGLRVALSHLDDAMSTVPREHCYPEGLRCGACEARDNAASAAAQMQWAVNLAAPESSVSRYSAAVEAVENLREHLQNLQGGCASRCADSSTATNTSRQSHMMALYLTRGHTPPYGQSPPVEDLAYLQQLGYSRLDMAGYYQVSESTTKRWCMAAGVLKRKRPQIDDTTLSELLRTIKAGIGKNWGWRLVMGYLSSCGYDVTCARLKAAMPKRLVRVGHSTTRVKQYKVKGPNALWHVDGNHKLKEWGFYIHGCIDGGTSFVHYLRLSDRNTSAVALQPYVEACEKYQGCSRVRLDAGSENVDIARYQLLVRGEGRGSVLIGPSVHNQRIERLWRDVREGVLDRFRGLFSTMRNELFIWDDCSTLDRHCLFWVFKGVIQSSLDVFQDTWNNHHIHRKGTPQNLYAPCLRWEQVDDATMEELRTTGRYTIVVREMADMVRVQHHWTHYSTDPVVSGCVDGFTCNDACRVYEAVVAELGELSPWSDDAHMIKFYSVYRLMANDLKASEEWPVIWGEQ